MIRKFFLFAVTFVFSTGLSAQKLSVLVNYLTNDAPANKNNIYYQPGQLLVWDDFIGKPVEGSDAVALTSAGFGLKLMFRQVENAAQLMISVTCSFPKKDSWVLPGNKTAFILNHEQKHFDIAYIHTALFIQNLKTANFTKTNYAALIEKIYNQTAEGMAKMQNQYDLETSHSRVKEKQAEWDEKIDKQMALFSKEESGNGSQ